MEGGMMVQIRQRRRETEVINLREVKGVTRQVWKSRNVKKNKVRYEQKRRILMSFQFQQRLGEKV